MILCQDSFTQLVQPGEDGGGLPFFKWLYFLLEIDEHNSFSDRKREVYFNLGITKIYFVYGTYKTHCGKKNYN